VHCIDESKRCRRLAGTLALLVVVGASLAGCASGSRTTAAGGGAVGPETASSPNARPSVGSTPAPLPTARGASSLPAPTERARNWTEYQRFAARRMMAASPDAVYSGRPPEPLLAIPVLEVELNADGSVLRVNVMRPPSQAQDTIQLAVNAVHRAAPYGDVRHLPRPWRFSEVFLFDDNRRFKPRSLD
jgi:hypothetical protein